MAVKPADFKSAASTDFATPALPRPQLSGQLLIKTILWFVNNHAAVAPCVLIMHEMTRRQTANPASPAHSLHQLGAEIASAERFALLQRVAVYPAALRREVVKHSLNGVPDSTIATTMRIPLNDVHAIMEAFTQAADEHANEGSEPRR